MERPRAVDITAEPKRFTPDDIRTILIIKDWERRENKLSRRARNGRGGRVI